MFFKPRCPVCLSQDIKKETSQIICNTCQFKIGPVEKKVEELTAKQATQHKDAILLDIRQPNEHQIAHIPHAIFIPQQNLPQNLDKLDKSKEIICFCHHGGRSRTIARYLLQNGFNAKNMAGSIDAWSRDVDPSIPRY